MAPKARRPEIEIRGAREVRRALRGFDDGLEDLKDIHEEIGQIVAARAEDLVPVETGDLRGSIRPTRTKTRATVKAGGRRVPYAGVIHFGWPRHNIEPDPFLYDAADDRRDEVMARYRRGIDGLIVDVDVRMPK